MWELGFCFVIKSLNISLKMNFQPGELSGLEKNKKDGFKVSISIWNQLRYSNFKITFNKLHHTFKYFRAY